MQKVYCWNCLRSVEKVRSETSGNLYCVACGAAIAERVVVTGLSIFETGFSVEESDHGEKVLAREATS